MDDVYLPEETWRARERDHVQRADALTAAHRERAQRGEKHPVEDFLFTYYSYKPAILRRWHPGAHVCLANAESDPRAQWRWYTAGSALRSLRVDHKVLLRERGDLLTSTAHLLRSTASRRPGFGCFGLHEWAMVYREADHRHPAPLRLGRDGTDSVVESHDLACTHFDAFRFFTPDAVPRNRLPLTRAGQAEREQPGCLHAGMDLYKWAVKLGPLVPGEDLLDAFELARDVRSLDMEASPYDLREWGLDPVRIETADGKAEYVRRQRGFAERSAVLRRTLLQHLERVIAAKDI